MTKDQIKILKGIREELEYGDKVEISSRCGYTREYVGMCLNPKKDCYNEKIVSTALEVISERKERQKLQLKTLQN